MADDPSERELPDIDPSQRFRIGGPPLEIQLSFRVSGPHLDPDEVSRLLALEPHHQHRRGDARSSPRYAPYRTGLWTWQTSLPETEPLEAHLSLFLDTFEPKAEALKQLQESGWEMDLFLGVFGRPVNFGFSLAPDHLYRIGKLHLEMSFDIYEGGDEDDLAPE